MSGITTSISVLISSVFIASLIKIIAPAGKTEKILKLVISLFVLICIAVSFESVFESIKVSVDRVVLSDKKEDGIKKAVDSEVLKATGDYIAEYMNSTLASEGVMAELIEVGLDIDENAVINMTAVNIYIEQKDSAYEERIIEIIEEYTDITPTVYIRE